MDGQFRPCGAFPLKRRIDGLMIDAVRRLLAKAASETRPPLLSLPMVAASQNCGPRRLTAWEVGWIDRVSDATERENLSQAIGISTKLGVIKLHTMNYILRIGGSLSL